MHLTATSVVLGSRCGAVLGQARASSEKRLLRGVSQPLHWVKGALALSQRRCFFQTAAATSRQRLCTRSALQSKAEGRKMSHKEVIPRERVLELSGHKVREQSNSPQPANHDMSCCMLIFSQLWYHPRRSLLCSFSLGGRRFYRRARDVHSVTLVQSCV